jgi:putative ABC transport system substrate-binding protein
MITPMHRRSLLALLGGTAAAWPLGAGAQQNGGMRRVAAVLVGSENDPQWQARVAAFRTKLQELGWIVGRNLTIDYYWGVIDTETATATSVKILKVPPDVILANGSPAVASLQRATRSIPIVFTLVSEPMAQSFIESLAHPGGNITGFTNLEPTFGAKWLEMLKEIAPAVRRVGVMFNPSSNPGTNSSAALLSNSVETAARRLGMDTVAVQVRSVADINAAMATLTREPGTGLIFPSDAFLNSNYKAIVELAARYALPAIYPFRYFADAGGMVSYGVDGIDQHRRAASYVDRILRGDRPVDLPVQQPVKFELVLNMKTAKALGLSVPLTLQVAADEVIE